MQLQDLLNPVLYCSLIIVAAVLFGIFALFKVRRFQRNERPPLSRMLRRSAGHRLSQELEVLNERVWTLIIWLIGGTLLFVFTFLFALAPSQNGQSPLGVVAEMGIPAVLQMPAGSRLLLQLVASIIGGLAAAAYGGIRLYIDLSKMRNLHLGLRGEQAVAEVLGDAVGFRAYHDIQGAPFGNVDHVVVGRGGIFAIETKTRRKKLGPSGKEDHVVECDGNVLRFPWGNDHNAVTQARANARWLQKEIRERAGIAVEVIPVIVIPGWFVRHVARPEILVLNDTAFGTHLGTQRDVLTDIQVGQACRMIADKVSDVEF